jgi:uncharacterized membrane protein YhhN
MTPLAAVLLALVGACAVTNWWAVAAGHRRVEVIAKPLTMALLIAAAVVIEPTTASVKVWFVVGLAFSLAGDVFLLFEERWFVAGLASFLAAHIAYTAGLTRVVMDAVALGVGIIIVVAAIAFVGRHIHRAAASTSRRLAIPVGLYIAAISIMLVAAIGTRNPIAIAGAASFYLSDTILGWNRFVAPVAHGKLWTMVSYHAAQALLVLSVLTL